MHLPRMRPRWGDRRWPLAALMAFVLFGSAGCGSSATGVLTPTTGVTAGAPPRTGATKPLPPGAALPGDAACAGRVPASGWEPRPENEAANHSVPSAGQLAGLEAWGPRIGLSARADALRMRVTGNYMGTTDQILQWGACKWGWDPDLARAQAVAESYWRQGLAGDVTGDQASCPPGGPMDGARCYQSYGLLQVKYTYHKGAWPMIRQDTAFNVDFAYGWIRACYEGWVDYLYDRTPTLGNAKYHAGDIWGCLGFWYSGSWYDGDAISYIAHVKAYYDEGTWQSAAFFKAR